MRIISFGDLYCDYYIKNGKDIYVSGGKSDANILVNLSRYFKCAYFGVCGNDPEGNIAVSCLKDVGIETYIREVQDETKTMMELLLKYVLIVRKDMVIVELKWNFQILKLIKMIILLLIT